MSGFIDRDSPWGNCGCKWSSKSFRNGFGVLGHSVISANNCKDENWLGDTFLLLE